MQLHTIKFKISLIRTEESLSLIATLLGVALANPLLPMCFRGMGKLESALSKLMSTKAHNSLLLTAFKLCQLSWLLRVNGTTLFLLLLEEENLTLTKYLTMRYKTNDSDQYGFRIIY